MFVIEAASKLRDAPLGAVFKISPPSAHERRIIDALGYWAARMSPTYWTIRRERRGLYTGPYGSILLPDDRPV
jgi:hypothetical protein